MLRNLSWSAAAANSTEDVGDLKDEMPHRLGVHQRLAVVRSTEARGVDGDQVRGGGEVWPVRLEGIYAFRPRAHEDRIGTALAAFGIADRQSVNRDFLRVNQGAHGLVRAGRTAGLIDASMSFIFVCFPTFFSSF